MYLNPSNFFLLSTGHCGKSVSNFCYVSADLQLQSARCRCWTTYLSLPVVSASRSKSRLEDSLSLWTTGPQSVRSTSEYGLWIYNSRLQPERRMPGLQQSLHSNRAILMTVSFRPRDKMFSLLFCQCYFVGFIASYIYIIMYLPRSSIVCDNFCFAKQYSIGPLKLVTYS